jgi:hypothetical protein
LLKGVEVREGISIQEIGAGTPRPAHVELRTGNPAG